MRFHKKQFDPVWEYQLSQIDLFKIIFEMILNYCDS